MEREEILKALECCSERFGMCDECPYEEEEGCEAEMRSDARDLIRELTEENELLKAGISTEFTCIFGAPHKVRDCPVNDEIARAKAETVREMAERVKKKINEINMNLCGVYPFIDQIAKEMLEEDQ